MEEQNKKRLHKKKSSYTKRSLEVYTTPLNLQSSPESSAVPYNISELEEYLKDRDKDLLEERISMEKKSKIIDDFQMSKIKYIEPLSHLGNESRFWVYFNKKNKNDETESRKFFFDWFSIKNQIYINEEELKEEENSQYRSSYIIYKKRMERDEDPYNIYKLDPFYFFHNGGKEVFSIEINSLKTFFGLTQREWNRIIDEFKSNIDPEYGLKDIDTFMVTKTIEGKDVIPIFFLPFLFQTRYFRKDHAIITIIEDIEKELFSYSRSEWGKGLQWEPTYLQYRYNKELLYKQMHEKLSIFQASERLEYQPLKRKIDKLTLEVKSLQKNIALLTNDKNDCVKPKKTKHSQ